MEEQITKLNQYINEYYKGELNGHTLNDLGKNISALDRDWETTF